MPDVTWGEIRRGDTVRDRNGGIWTVTRIVQQGGEAVGHVAAIIRNDAGVQWDVTRESDATIHRLETAELGEAIGQVKQKLGGEVISREERVSAPLESGGEVLPTITEPFELRAHLYLFHTDTMVQFPGTALAEIHRRDHDPVRYMDAKHLLIPHTHHSQDRNPS